MTTRIFRVSMPGDLELAFNFVAACISSAGLVIRNPETGRITSWSDEGEQIVTTPEELLKKIKAGSLENVQFWSSSSEDMFVSWSGDGRRNIFLLHLDGVDILHSVAVASKLVEGLLMQYTSTHFFGDAFALTYE
ncbi:hypothetical protein GCM10027093_62650 [Paraburkholderia jirisanensis]